MKTILLGIFKGSVKQIIIGVIESVFAGVISEKMGSDANKVALAAEIKSALLAYTNAL